MDLKTSLAYQLAKGRLRQIDTYVERAEDLQSHQLRHLLDRARHTEFGRSYSLDKTTTSSDFASRIPIQDYEGYKGDIERMVPLVVLDRYTGEGHPRTRRLPLVRQVKRYDQ